MEIKNRILVEGAVCSAIAVLLSAIIPTVEWIDLSLGIIPIIIFSLRRGLKAGLISGFIWGLLMMVLGRASILNIWQGILEYPLANMVVGLAGIFHQPLVEQVEQEDSRSRKTKLLLCSAIGLGVGLKYFLHFIAGVIFWGSYVQWGLTPVWYSLVVNGGSFLLNYVIVFLIVSILIVKMPQIISGSDK